MNNMKDAINSDSDIMRSASAIEEVEECCGSCKHMKYEDADGFGVCFKFDTPVYCGDDACKLYEEDI